jgi:hypothetical protein
MDMPRQRRTPVSNTALQTAITATGRPYGKIAVTINAIGAENGQSLYYDSAAVAHWLTGTVPRSGSVPVIVEAFTRLLGRELTAHDLGWPYTEAPPAEPWKGDPVAWVTRLGRDDMLNRRSLLTTGLYSLAALNLPAEPYRIATRTGQSRRGGASDVVRIRTMSKQFATADALYGGGHARTALLAYLVHEVSPLLHGSTGRARPELFTAASQMTYLAAFMSSDAGSAGLAQRYYIQAVRLADEAGDPTAKATALRGLAVQAVELGHPAAAVDLAEAAASTLRSGCPARTRAWMAGMRADAHAAHGNVQAAHTALRQAEADLERADSVPASQWTGAYCRSALEHQTGFALAHLCDLPAAERHLLNSVQARSVSERRSLTLITARLASVQLRMRRPDRAATTILELRDDLPLLTSARISAELAKLREGWIHARTNTTVNAADKLITSLNA